jgi:RHS repeat-associated protein
MLKPSFKSTSKSKWCALAIWALVALMVVDPILAPMACAQGPAIQRLSAPPPPAMPKHMRLSKGPKKPAIIRPKLFFSKNPSDLELCTSRFFLEPLAPMPGKVVPGENHALASALLAFAAKKNFENVSDLTKFLRAFPQSRWCPSLEVNLANIRYDTGYLSDALSYWSSAWNGAKTATEANQQAVAAVAISKLVLAEARLGRKEELEEHLNEIEKRPIGGSAGARIRDAKVGLSCMKTRPDIAYKCGPCAVDSILFVKGSKAANIILKKAKSTDKGTNLAQVKALADQVGLHYQIAKRSKTGPLIVPSVMHWKVGHFASIVAQSHGVYQIKDPTFDTAGTNWITKKAIDAETDGYFLIPSGAMPAGWSHVSTAEAGTVWGKGNATSQDGAKTPTDPHQCPGTNCGCNGMARASAFTMQADLNIQDIPLSYATPIGPKMDFLVNYNFQEGYQPATMKFPNFGANWSFNWVSYVTLSAATNPTAYVSVRGGGYETYTYSQPNNVTNPYMPYLTSQAVLSIPAEGVYQRQLPDGTIEVFNQVDSTGLRYFMTEIIDPHGVSTSITYDSNFRISAITDSVGSGQMSSVGYVSNITTNAGFYKIASITDPSMVRSATFSYDSTDAYLLSITDVIGLTSQFTYGVDYSSSGNFITAMTTPYGTTSFVAYQPASSPSMSRGLQFIFPDGTTSVLENWLSDTRNTYFWDREAMMLYPNDRFAQVYSHCTTTHFLGSSASAPVFETQVIGSITPPLEQSYNYQYLGQSGEDIPNPVNNLPIQVSRTTSSGTQTWTYQYNAFGKVTQSVDPVGRTFTYKYAANNIDLLEKRQTQGTNNDLNGKWEYNNTQHVPNTYIDGSGQKTQYAYNSFGELTTLTDANSNVWTNTYNTSGYRTQLQGPLSGSNDVTAFSYDGYGRLYQVTDSEGYTLTYSYDNADRLTQTTFPDGTYEQIVYSRLDAVMFKDRIGRWSQRSYDSMDQLAYEIDPLSRKTQYTWCACGSLATLTDPSGNVTTWNHDLEGRVIQKVYPDNSIVSSAYDTVGRLQSKTDALNQTINFAYNLDNTLSQKSYTNAVNPTSTVNYTFDPNYLRLSTVQNGWGTITDSYNPYITDPFGTPTTGGGMLSTVSNNVIANSSTSYTFDALGRTTNRSINGSSNSTTWTFDAMSRVTAEANPLGTFNYHYVDDTSGSSKGTLRLSSINYPNSQATNFSWYGNTGDQRLLGINNLTPSGAPRSQFNYSYDSAGEIISWAQQNAGYTPIQNDLTYDLAGQLVGAQGGSGNQNPLSGSQNYYAYDFASNRAAVQSNIIQTATIGGTITASDTLTITVQDSALSGGQEVVNYTVQSGDTTTTIAANLAAAITADTNLQTLGVNAVSAGKVITFKSASPNQTSFTESTSAGATETITLGVSRNASQNVTIGGTKTTGDTITITVYDAALSGGHEAVTYAVQSSDTLTTIASGVKSAINGDTNLQTLGVTATSASTVVNIKSASTNLTTYTESTNSGATETATQAINMNSSQIAIIGGSKTTADTVTLNVYDAGLSGGQNATTYTVQSSDTLTTIASGLASAVNANTSLQAIGVSATSSGAVVTLNSNSINITGYTGSRSSGATETIVVEINPNGTETAAIGGSKTTGDVLTVTVYDAGLSGGSTAVSYTVLSSDNLTTIASGLASAINGNSSLSSLGVSATAVSTVVNIKSTSTNLTTYGQSTNSGATETITLGPSANVSQSLYNNLNELVKVAAGGAATFTGGTNKAAKSVTVGTQVIYIHAPAPSQTTYSPINTGATETLSFGQNVNNAVTVTVSGTITTGDVLVIEAQNGFMPTGHSTSYTVQSGDTLTSIATGLASAINGDTVFIHNLVSATSSGSNLTITASPPSYSYSHGSTETMTPGTNINGNVKVVIGGTPTLGDTLSITVQSPGLAGLGDTISYTIQTGDTITSATLALINNFNSNSTLATVGITASSGAANLNWTESFTGSTEVPAGTSTATVTAVDGANNSKTNPYQLSVKGVASQSLTFDLNGNMTSDGTNTYQWDAENRLIQINYPGTGNNSQFTYDGFDRCIEIAEMSGGTTTSTKQFVWCDGLSEARNSSGAITGQYFVLGEVISGSSYLFTRDYPGLKIPHAEQLSQLRLAASHPTAFSPVAPSGSVREMTDNSGNIQAQYAYNLYGQVTKLGGSLSSDFQYAGYYVHIPSKLNLTWFRQYNPSQARWISRDPVGEVRLTNLYDYASNNPIEFVDQYGLYAPPAVPPFKCPNGNPGCYEYCDFDSKVNGTNFSTCVAACLNGNRLKGDIPPPVGAPPGWNQHGSYPFPPGLYFIDPYGGERTYYGVPPETGSGIWFGIPPGYSYRLY